MSNPSYLVQTPASLRTKTAIVPWGAVEWHGEHLPFGVDGFIAEGFATALAGRIDGTVLPVQWSAITTLPHQFSLSISTATFRALADETVANLFNADFERVCIVSGHYAQGHMIELYEASLRAIQKFGRPVFTATPLELLEDPSLLDHAGRSETSQMLFLDFESVDLSALPTKLNARDHAVLGDHPDLASAAEGQNLLQRGLDAWTDWLSEPGNLVSHYATAIAQYDDYRDRFYRTSWEQAIRDWWATK